MTSKGHEFQLPLLNRGLVSLDVYGVSFKQLYTVICGLRCMLISTVGWHRDFRLRIIASLD